MIYTVTLNPAVDRELVVPVIEFDSVLRASDWRVDCGGKGFNVSRMLMSLGKPSVALGFAGGRSGELLRDALKTLGIQTKPVWIEGETRTNVSIVTSQHDHYIKVNEPGPMISAEDQEKLLAQIGELVQPGDWWVLSGSLPPGLSTTIYAEIIAIVQEAGAFTVLDASGEALRHGCEAGPLLAKPNDVEAHQITGLPVNSLAELATAASAIREMGVANIVISLGAKGALLADDQGAWTLSSPVIEERNPIGAGDSLIGGLVWGLDEGLPLPEALRWGIACGAATASQNGTAVGSRVQVEELVAQVKVKPFNPASRE